MTLSLMTYFIASDRHYDEAPSQASATPLRRRAMVLIDSVVGHVGSCLSSLVRDGLVPGRGVAWRRRSV